MMAWFEKNILAYVLSIALPLARVIFEHIWYAPETMTTEIINACIEVLSFCLYAYLINRLAEHSRRMASTITAQRAEMTHLRAFAQTRGRTFRGRAISPGLADGMAVIHLPAKPVVLTKEHIRREEVEAETCRFERALSASIRDLNDLVKQREECADEITSVKLVEIRV
ncbi:hypothetical protein HQ394_07160 [Defluviicoccus vanus]|uniref:Phosphotransferase system enzyme I N-terminal domain-containing protein n=2 Tax=Defluviicoccus vanus TaxID=111831 RepID=A0A7H1N0C3_9PROT|nr:hypothetical protein HQ394_07160 [Defluviicoccus vanus]